MLFEGNASVDVTTKVVVMAAARKFKELGIVMIE